MSKNLWFRAYLLLVLVGSVVSITLIFATGFESASDWVIATAIWIAGTLGFVLGWNEGKDN